MMTALLRGKFHSSSINQPRAANALAISFCSAHAWQVQNPFKHHKQLPVSPLLPLLLYHANSHSRLHESHPELAETTWDGKFAREDGKSS